MTCMKTDRLPSQTKVFAIIKKQDVLTRFAWSILDFLNRLQMNNEWL